MDKHAIVSRLIEIDDHSQRLALLESLCSGDDQLRQEVEASLAARDLSMAATDFPSKPSDGTTPDLGRTSSLVGKTLGRYHILENKILPLYYDKPDDWWKIVLQSMNDVSPFFDSDRMAREYYEKLFAPAEEPALANA